MAEIKVIDVSAWNGNVDFSALVSHGVKAGIIRITERYDKTDSYFERNYTGFKSVGIKTGVYKFSYALSVSEIQKEARTVISVLNGRKLDYPVFLDLEWSTQRALGKSAITKMVKAFRKIIVDAGYQFAIYCNVDWYNNALDTASLPYDYWLAAYPANDTGAIVERIRPNKGIAWQYTSKYKINGKNFDMSVFYKDYSSTASGGDTNMVTTQQIIDSYVDFMVRMANDNTHGYSQAVRSLYNITNPTSFDCSSLTCTAIYYAFKKYGISPTPKDFGCSYTGNMMELLKCGFEVVATNQTAHSQMRKGDIELNTIHHVAVAIDKDNIVHARSSEGTSNTRDDSGNEIRIQPWYLYGKGWTHRLRFTGKGLDLSNATPDSSNKVSVPNTTYNTPWVGKCTADDVNVRTGAGTNYPNASYPKLNKDNRMDVLGETGEWYYVNIQGNKGYISKRYVVKVKSSSSGSNSTPTKSNKVIKNGQVHANNFAGTGISADGIRGTATVKAAKKVLQQGLNLDYRAGLEIDGEIGILTHRALGNHYVEYGEKQYMVTVLEILLMLKGYETNGVESPGVYGSGLKSAVKKWASDNGVSVNSNGRVTASMFLKLIQ